MATKKRTAKKRTTRKSTKTQEGVVGYNVKLKEKNRLMSDVVINVKSGRYIATGVDAETGDSMAAIMSRANAEAAIENGWADEGEGWD